MFNARCLCGKLCTSAPGLTLHQKCCLVAKQATKEGKKSTFDSGVVASVKYVDEVQKLVDLVEVLAEDANQALTHHNRSAGRRARTLLLKVRDRITPLRKKILDTIKD